ncbi:Leukocyte elastase inhibitor [Entamoeba marina]
MLPNRGTFSKATLTYEKLDVVRNKMYEFITKYHLVNPLDDNIFSAYSMFLAFAVLYPGADGETKQQLEKVFGFNEISDNFEKSIACLLNCNGDDTIAIENTLWIDKKFEIKKEYEETSQRMQSTLNSANFETKPEEERARINKHVEKITHNLIKDLLPQNSVKTDTHLIITNAMYFKDKWEKEFDLMGKGINFKNVGEVKSMKVVNNLKSSVSENVTTVSIPYKHGYYLTIIMPKDMKSFEQSSDFKHINELILTNLKGYGDRTYLEMPLFKLEKTADLKESLIKLGLVDTFKEIANFNKISDIPLCVDGAIHKAFVHVNEKETVAAAATAVQMLIGCCRPPPIKVSITIDKPFFSIISRTDALPLFFSKVTHPKE